MHCQKRKSGLQFLIILKVRKMKKYFLCICSILLFFGATAQKVFINDPNAELRPISGSFSKLEISGGIDLFLSQYDNEAIAVSAASREYKRNIKTIVENNVLKIYFDGSNQWNSVNKKSKVYVSFKTLERIKASGACDIQVAGFIQVPKLSLVLNGSSDFKGAVQVGTINMELNGASDVRISGTADFVMIQSSGASDVKGYDLVTDVCNAKASGASDINITVNKELNAHASGASDIYYKGNAVIKDMYSSGASSVVKKN